MAEYDNFSRYYDALMENVDYAAKTEYALKLFERFDKKPTLLLDVGCGSGGFSLQFAKKEIEVIGADISEGMLVRAREKAEKEKLNVLFLNQSAADLDLYGTVDGAVCFMDTVNHIIDSKELQKSFNKISLFLEKDRLFIFDVNTIYKHQEILGDNAFVFESDNLYCVWQNFYNKRSKLTDIYLDFFETDGELYTRTTDEFSERAYTHNQLENMLLKAGFCIEAVYGEDTFKKPACNSQRNIYIARKVK